MSAIHDDVQHRDPARSPASAPRRGSGTRPTGSPGTSRRTSTSPTVIAATTAARADAVATITLEAGCGEGYGMDVLAGRRLAGRRAGLRRRDAVRHAAATYGRDVLRGNVVRLPLADAQRGRRGQPAGGRAHLDAARAGRRAAPGAAARRAARRVDPEPAHLLARPGARRAAGERLPRARVRRRRAGRAGRLRGFGRRAACSASTAARGCARSTRGTARSRRPSWPPRPSGGRTTWPPRCATSGPRTS